MHSYVRVDNVGLTQCRFRPLLSERGARSRCSNDAAVQHVTFTFKP